MRTKALRKLDAAGGKRALIINLFSDGVSVPSCTSDERLIEVPGLLASQRSDRSIRTGIYQEVHVVIPTNQVKISFDYAAIARDFILFEVRRDQGDYKQSVVPDVASQQCHALAVVYDWGPSCYLLYKRDAAEQHALNKRWNALMIPCAYRKSSLISWLTSRNICWHSCCAMRSPVWK